MNHSITRRRLIKSTAKILGAAAFPQWVTSHVMGATTGTKTEKKITIGCIGVGGMGVTNLKSFLGQADCQVVAVCDVNSAARNKAQEMVNTHYQDTQCAVFADWRELIASKDIDAVMIATPDHWHSLMAVAAAKAGKDLYCEKPMGISLTDGQAIRDAVRKHQRVFQSGTWQRSANQFRYACELVRNGYLGKIHTIEVATDGTKYTAGYKGPQQSNPAPLVPEGFDWKMWQGPAQLRDYHPARHSGDWFMIQDYSNGWPVNWGVHHLDIAMWGVPELGTVPFEIESKVTWRNEGFTDTINEWHATYIYENGLKLIFTDQKKMATGCRFIGDKGWIRVDRQWKDHPGLVAEPESLLKIALRPDDLRLYESNNHVGNFLECIKTRKDPISDVDATHKACSLALLTVIAGQLGQKLKWDPQTERVIGNEEANRLLHPPMHNGWKI